MADDIGSIHGLRPGILGTDDISFWIFQTNPKKCDIIGKSVISEKWWYLNTKCISYFSLPFVHNGGGGVGPLGPIHFYVFSPSGISVRNLHHICIHLKQP